MIRRPPRSTLFPYTTLSVVAVSLDRKSTRLNSSHTLISYADFCLKKKTEQHGRLGTKFVDSLIGGGQNGPTPGRVGRVPPFMATSFRGSRSSPGQCLFFLNKRRTPETCPLPLPDALPI